jgi:hypothetical protein
MLFGWEDQVCPVCALPLEGVSTLQHLEAHGFSPLDAYRLSAKVSIFINNRLMDQSTPGSCTLVTLVLAHLLSSCYTKFSELTSDKSYLISVVWAP